MNARRLVNPAGPVDVVVSMMILAGVVSVANAALILSGGGEVLAALRAASFFLFVGVGLSCIVVLLTMAGWFDE